MEHYSLQQPGPVLPATGGMRVLVVRSRQVGGVWETTHDVLAVVGIQPITIHHYFIEATAPVHPDPILMEKHGWTYRHLEMRYAPVFITPEGRLSGIDPDDPRWSLISPEFTTEQIQALAVSLQTREVERQALERRIEEEEEIASDIEED